MEEDPGDEGDGTRHVTRSRQVTQIALPHDGLALHAGERIRSPSGGIDP